MYINKYKSFQSRGSFRSRLRVMDISKSQYGTKDYVLEVLQRWSVDRTRVTPWTDSQGHGFNEVQLQRSNDR